MRVARCAIEYLENNNGNDAEPRRSDPQTHGGAHNCGDNDQGNTVSRTISEPAHDKHHNAAYHILYAKHPGHFGHAELERVNEISAPESKQHGTAPGPQYIKRDIAPKGVAAVIQAFRIRRAF